MSENLYSLLGLTRTCSKEEIKKAYRKAAIAYHPDKLKPDSSEEEKGMFVKIRTAYEVLMDDERRNRYDVYGIVDDNQQAPSFSHSNMNDIINMLFKSSGFNGMNHHTAETMMKVDPIIINVSIELEEVATGVEKTIVFERNALIDIETNKTTSPQGIIFACEACKGTRSVFITTYQGHLITQSKHPCNKCKATGYVNAEPSKYKFIKKKCKFDYKFRRGIKEGDQHIFQGLGNINPLYPKHSGDVIITIKYASTSNPRFRTDRIGNLIYTQQISVFESITGTEFTIKHPDGRILAVEIPPVPPNCKEVVKRLGLPQKSEHSEEITTDLVIIFEVIYPIINDEQNDFLKSYFDEFYHPININSDSSNVIKLDFSINHNERKNNFA